VAQVLLFLSAFAQRLGIRNNPKELDTFGIFWEQALSGANSVWARGGKPQLDRFRCLGTQCVEPPPEATQ
jgi:hypothetical protein